MKKCSLLNTDLLSLIKNVFWYHEKKGDIMKIYFIEYKLALIKWKYILILWKKRWLNKYRPLNLGELPTVRFWS